MKWKIPVALVCAYVLAPAGPGAGVAAAPHGRRQRTLVYGSRRPA